MEIYRIRTFLIVSIFMVVNYTCTPPMEVYFINKSGEFCKIEIIMKNTEYHINNKTNFKYADTILEINKKTSRHLDKNLVAEIINDSSFIINIPKNSTLRIDGYYFISGFHTLTINDSISYNYTEFSTLAKKAKGWNRHYFEFE